MFGACLTGAAALHRNPHVVAMKWCCCRGLRNDTSGHRQAQPLGEAPRQQCLFMCPLAEGAEWGGKKKKKEKGSGSTERRGVEGSCKLAGRLEGSAVKEGRILPSITALFVQRDRCHCKHQPKFLYRRCKRGGTKRGSPTT